MPDQYSPQAIWGRLLKHYRNQAGLTQVELAEIITYVPSLISGIETGVVLATPPFAKACDSALKTGGALLISLDWRKGEAVPSWFDWPKHESLATKIRSYEQTVVPGLLQTPGYARAILHGSEAAVDNRLARQAVLSREAPPPPILTCVIHETVLYHLIGSAEIMREQLSHLVASVSKRVNLHVVPYGEERPWVVGSFAIATLDDTREIAYVETAIRGMTLGDSTDIRELNEAYELVRSQALPVNMSLDLISKAVEERWS